MGNVYLDYAATTPVDEQVLQVMLPYFREHFGNPSSVHMRGQEAETALEDARQTVARCLQAFPDEVIFTSCGTESDNLALRGAALAERKRRGANRILISPVEHHAISHTAQQLAAEFGFQLNFLNVDEFGRVDPEDVAASLEPDTAVVSVIYANNEIGTINPIAEIGEICEQREVPFHTDAVQAAAHLQMDVQRDHVKLLSIGAHKFYGPKGIGALYARRGVFLTPTQTGGKQENGMRAGTHNIPYIVGLAEALKNAQQNTTQNSRLLVNRRDWLIGQVLETIPRVKLTGHPIERLPNHASFAFEGVDGNHLLMQLDLQGFACSSGSACKVGTPEASEVLKAIGLSNSWALGSLRVTLGKETTEEDLARLMEVLPAAVEQARM